MAGDTGLQIEQISTNLNKLIAMHTDVMRMRNHMISLRQQNASGVLPDIPAVSRFSTRFQGRLDDLDREVYAISEEIEACRLALAESARSLQDQDDAVHDRLLSLAQRLETAGYATGRPLRAV